VFFVVHAEPSSPHTHTHTHTSTHTHTHTHFHQPLSEAGEEEEDQEDTGTRMDPTMHWLSIAAIKRQRELQRISPLTRCSPPSVELGSAAHGDGESESEGPSSEPSPTSPNTDPFASEVSLVCLTLLRLHTILASDHFPSEVSLVWVVYSQVQLVTPLHQR
jgi:hypothetical protein